MAKFLTRYGGTTIRLRIKRGEKLAPGQESKTGIYMVCTSACGTPLRASLIQGVAEEYRSEERELYEGILVR